MGGVALLFYYEPTQRVQRVRNGEELVGCVSRKRVGCKDIHLAVEIPAVIFSRRLDSSNGGEQLLIIIAGNRGDLIDGNLFI